MSKSMGLFFVLGALCAVGCGDKGGTTGGDSSSKPASTGDAKSGGTAKAGGGSYDDYIAAVCACKNTQCVADAAVKYTEVIQKDSAKVTPEQAKKLGDCTTAAMK